MQQSRSGGGACGASNNVTLGSQPAAGDLIVIYAQINSTGKRYTAPSGFSTKDSKAGSWFQAVEYYKIATGSEGTSYNIGSNCSGRTITWVVADIRGENQSNPFDRHNSTIDTATRITTFKTASLTPTHAGDLPISVIAPGSNGLRVSFISPSNWTLDGAGKAYTQRLYHGPATDTAAVSFSETTSSATSWASLETIDLINAAPAATATTTPATTTNTSSVPVVVQSRSGGASCSSNNNVTLSSQPRAGDLIVIYAQANTTGNTFTAPSGFSDKDSKNGSWFQAVEYYKIATGSEGTTYVIGSNCSGRLLTWIAADIRGENQSNPFDGHNATIDTATRINKFSTASLTPSHSNDLPISLIAPGSNGLTVSYVSPSGWSLSAAGPYYTQRLYKGPATATSAVSFSLTTSSSTNWASLETLDLINPAGSSTTTTATPGPAPTTNPTPTSKPVTTSSSGAAYTFHGVQVYPSCDWFTTPLDVTPSCSSYAVSTVDPNSANIINNFDASSVCGGSCKLTVNASTVSVEYGKVAGNVATSSTPLYTVSGCAYGCSDDAYGDNPKHQIPFTSAFLGQGNCSLNNSCAGCKGISGCYTSPPYSECRKDDCHVVVVNSSSGIDYETYVFGSFPFNGSSYNAESLATYNLKQPYRASGSGATAAGLPLLGTDDMGEDASSPSINHVAYMVLPGSDGSSVAAGGHVAPASAGPACVSSCTNKLPFGARLRLKASYTCPSPATNPQANKICLQLKTYGMIVMDHGTSNGTFQIELGESSNGSNPWNSSDLSAITGVPLSDFEVMTLGTLY